MDQKPNVFRKHVQRRPRRGRRGVGGVGRGGLNSNPRSSTYSQSTTASDSSVQKSSAGIPNYSVTSVLSASCYAQEYAKLVATNCLKSNKGASELRKEVLSRCQADFQEGIQDGKTKAEFLKEMIESASGSSTSDFKTSLQATHDDKMKKLRQKALANISLIAELFKVNLLTPKFIMESVMTLLNAGDEESLTKLCLLLSSVGRKLYEDLEKLEAVEKRIKIDPDEQPKSPRFVPEANWMARRISQVKNICIHSHLSPPLRLLLVEVVELSENQWTPNGFPKTLEDIVQVQVFRNEDKTHPNQTVAGDGDECDPAKRPRITSCNTETQTLTTELDHDLDHQQSI